jgi:hypothetical protein
LALGGEGRGPIIAHLNPGLQIPSRSVHSSEVDAKEDPVDAKRRGGRKHKSVFH